MSQVGVFLAYANDGLWTWVDGELFIPEAWFKREGSKDRKGLAIPPDRRFQTKIELGWQMIERVGQEGCRSSWSAGIRFTDAAAGCGGKPQTQGSGKAATLG